MLYARALEVSGWERASRLRATADTALFVSGFFPDSLPRGDRDLGYYATLGEQAYARLGRDHEREAPDATGVFTELASRFREFVDLLTEIGEKTRLTTPGVARAAVRALAADRQPARGHACSSSRASPRPSQTRASGTERRPSLPPRGWEG